MSNIQAVSHTPPVTHAAPPKPVANKTPAVSPDHNGDTDTGSIKLSAAKPRGVGTKVDVKA